MNSVNRLIAVFTGWYDESPGQVLMGLIEEVLMMVKFTGLSGFARASWRAAQAVRNVPRMFTSYVRHHTFTSDS
jgi:hypothetical protein